MGIAVSIVALLVGGSPRLFLIHESLVTGAMGLLALTSLAWRRPLAARTGPPDVPGPDDCVGARLAERVRPQGRDGLDAFGRAGPRHFTLRVQWRHDRPDRVDSGLCPPSARTWTIPSRSPSAFALTSLGPNDPFARRGQSVVFRPNQRRAA